jgi:hypothetical protein
VGPMRAPRIAVLEYYKQRLLRRRVKNVITLKFEGIQNEYIPLVPSFKFSAFSFPIFLAYVTIL